MTWRVAATAFVFLAGCSPDSEQGAAVNGHDTMSSAAATESPGGAGALSTSTQHPVGAGLRANVSALAGDVSGLTTRVSDVGLVIDLPSDALFDFDSATLTQDAEGQLRKAGNLIRQSPPGALHVIGHTDDRGDVGYNQELSNARAETVAAWLKQQVGIRSRAINVSGKGENEPVAPNSRPDGSDDPDGRAKNRRVEIVIPREGS